MDNLDWRKLDIDTLNLAKSEGESLLKETIETANYQVNRVYGIISVCIGIVILIIGFNSTAKIKVDLLHLESWILFIAVSIVLFKAFFAYRSFEIAPTGNNPSHLLSQTNLEYANSDLYKFLVYNCCRTIEESIVFNEISNEKRMKLIRGIESVIKISIIIIIFFPLVWFLFHLFAPVS